MQRGLLDTYRRPLQTRGLAAWALSAALLGAYVDLYFTEHLTPVATALHLPDKWTLYGAAYTIAMAAGAVGVLRRQGHDRYVRLRTFTLLGVQLLLAFLLPLVMRVLGEPALYFSYFWPLRIEALFPQTLREAPTYAAVWSVVGALVASPALAWRYGKRWYCGWVCGCGGLAETFGDPWRHLSDKGHAAWRVERLSVYAVLVAAIVVTGLMFASAASPADAGVQQVAEPLRDAYGFAIGACFSGVLGVGLYPLMGSRVWCRFGCPMAALLGLFSKRGHFRVRVKKDLCIACGNCSTYCEMGIDVRRYALENRDVRRASCVGCGVCAHVCPRGVLKLDSTPGRDGEPAVTTWTLEL